jgi:hypothetical protein
MSRHSVRLGLSLIVAAGCWIGPVQAQAPVQGQAPVQAPVLIGEPTVSEPIAVETSAALARHGIRLARWPLVHGQGGARQHMNQKGYCCDSHHDWYGCGGWRAQCAFMFGSCRTFFGEPCLPAPPRGYR